MAYLLGFKMDGIWIMKHLFTILILIISTSSFAKTGYENILTFDSKGWSSQKTPTGFGLSCIACDNQVMVSMDIVPINKTNKFTKSNEVFISSLMENKNQLALKMAQDTAIGGKVKLLKADKSKIAGKDVYRYMFIADMGMTKTFDNTSMMLHKDRMIKITLNYFDGSFTQKDRSNVDALFKSIKFTP
ncbi:hypothetical protein PYR73_05430 [Acinetobacter soli]|nr:hypothetical protein PYR73_05430 [Acinetobacter soli]